MGKVFVFDVAKCNGCRNCQIACKDEHVDNDWSPIARPQPDTGHFWCRIEERVRGQVPKVRVSYVMHRCQHCADAPCMAAAPEAVYRREDGLVIVDPEKAAGRRDLVEACPYGAIFWNGELGIPQKCTGCAHLVDAGEVPHCVDVCPHGALRFGDEEDLAEEIAAAEEMCIRDSRHEHGGGAHVHIELLHDGRHDGGHLELPERHGDACQHEQHRHEHVVLVRGAGTSAGIHEILPSPQGMRPADRRS